MFRQRGLPLYIRKEYNEIKELKGFLSQIKLKREVQV
jgi:hypothetical protein